MKNSMPDYLRLVTDAQPTVESYDDEARLAFAAALRELLDAGRQWLMVLDPPSRKTG